MPKYFPGVTHCLVKTVENAETMTAMKNTIATVALCFGADTDLFCPIRIKKSSDPKVDITADIPKTPVIKGGTKDWIPVLTGKAADEAKLLALVAFDKVKQQFGMKFGKKYRVNAKEIVDLTAPKEQAAS